MVKSKIKFPLKNNPEFITELRAKVSNYFEVNNISKYGNWKMVVKAIFMFSLYVTPYILMMTGVINSFTGVFTCWVLLGFGQAGVGLVVMHDANHRSWSKNQTLNKWMSKSMYLVGGFPPNWQHQHNTLHHGFTNIEGHDEDIDAGSTLRFSPHKPLLKMHKYQHVYAWFLYGLMTLMWVTASDFKQYVRFNKSGVNLSSRKTNKQLLVTLIISKLIYYCVFLVAPVIFLPFAWYWIIIFFLTMHFISGFLLTIIFQTAHVVPATKYPLPDDEGMMENNWAIHQLYTTSNFAPNNKVLTWLIGGLNYQVEHHLFPHISHIHYPKLSKLVENMANKYNLPYHVQPGFLKAIWEHGKMLKKLGRATI